MKLDERVVKLLKYAGPGGVSGYEIGAIIGLGTSRLYPLLARMESERGIASSFVGEALPRSRHYRLAEYAIGGAHDEQQDVPIGWTCG